jgi:hypothetical protein
MIVYGAAKNAWALHKYAALFAFSRHLRLGCRKGLVGVRADIAALLSARVAYSPLPEMCLDEGLDISGVTVPSVEAEALLPSHLVDQLQ